MLEAAIIGSARSMPGLFSMRRATLRLRRFNWRWTLAFTRKPPGWRMAEGVKYLNCPPKPGGFRVSRPRSVSQSVPKMEFGRRKEMKPQPYPSDLTDAQWAILEPLLPRPKPLG